MAANTVYSRSFESVLSRLSRSSNITPGVCWQCSLRKYSAFAQRPPRQLARRRLRAIKDRGQIYPSSLCFSARRDASNGDGKTPNRKPKEAFQKDSLRGSTRVLSERVRQRLQILTPHENIYTLPNILTFSRLLAAPAIGYLVIHQQHAWAVGLFVYAGVTDLVDGWIARRWKLQTVVGSVVDPMADKALMTVLVGCLAATGGLPLWLAVVIFGRDMSLGFAAIYYRYASLPPPKTFMRYWDFSIPSAEVHPTQVSKYNTFLQLVLIGSALTLPVITDNMLPDSITSQDLANAFTNFQYVVAGTTLWSGASYVWKKDAVRILGEDETVKRKQGFRGRLIIGVSFASFLALAVGLWRRDRSRRNDRDA